MIASLLMVSKRESLSYFAQCFISSGRRRASLTLLATLPPRPSFHFLTLLVAKRGTPSMVKECVQGGAPITLTLASLRLGGEFSKSGAAEVWPAPLGHFHPALVSRAGVFVTVVVRAAWVTVGALVVGTGGVQDWRSLGPWHNWSGQELCESDSTSLDWHLYGKLIQRDGSLDVKFFLGRRRSMGKSVAHFLLPLVLRVVGWSWLCNNDTKVRGSERRKGVASISSFFSACKFRKG